MTVLSDRVDQLEATNAQLISILQDLRGKLQQQIDAKQGLDVNWRGAWATATSFAENDAVSNGGNSYICTVPHTAGTANEPGVGVDEATYWDVMAKEGAAGSGTGDMLESTYDPNTIAADAFNRANHIGTPSIPDKIIHEGDADTSIRFPATDTFTVETAGTERLRIDSVGKTTLDKTLIGDASLSGFVSLSKNIFTVVQNERVESNSTALIDQIATVNIHARVGSSNTEEANSALLLQVSRGGSSGPGDLLKGYDTTVSEQVFRLRHNGDVLNKNNSYGALSDQRFKQDILDAGSDWDDIKNIRIRKYRLKSDVTEHERQGDATKAPWCLGVVSQEIEKVSPGLVQQAKLGDGSPDPDATKYVKYSILYLKAVNALQEAMVKIEDLTARVEDLERHNT